MRMLSFICDFQLVFALLMTYPDFLTNEFLIAITIVNLLACICLHEISIYGLMILDSSLLPILYDYISNLSDDMITKLFIIGLIVHITIIQNKVLASFL